MHGCGDRFSSGRKNAGQRSGEFAHQKAEEVGIEDLGTRGSRWVKDRHALETAGWEPFRGCGVKGCMGVRLGWVHGRALKPLSLGRFSKFVACQGEQGFL